MAEQDEEKPTEESAEDSGKVYPERMVVQRTPVRPQGSIVPTWNSVIAGLLTAAVFVWGGVRVVEYALKIYLRGGSSTPLAAAVMLPLGVPLLISAVAIERKKQAFGLALGAGTILGLLIAALVFKIDMHRPAAWDMPGATQHPR